MAATVYAINVYLTNGESGFLKFNGDGSWRWHVVSDVNEATLYRSKDECLDDFYKHVKGARGTGDSSVRVDTGRCRISECYCPWA